MKCCLCGKDAHRVVKPVCFLDKSEGYPICEECENKIREERLK